MAPCQSDLLLEGLPGISNDIYEYECEYDATKTALSVKCATISNYCIYLQVLYCLLYGWLIIVNKVRDITILAALSCSLVSISLMLKQ